MSPRPSVVKQLLPVCPKVLLERNLENWKGEVKHVEMPVPKPVLWFDVNLKTPSCDYLTGSAAEEARSNKQKHIGVSATIMNWLREVAKRCLRILCL